MGFGSGADMEFLSHTLILLNAHAHPELLEGNPSKAIEKLSGAGLLSKKLGSELIAASNLLGEVQSILRQSTDLEFDEQTAPEGLKTALVAATKEKSFEALRNKLVQKEKIVYASFQEIIELPARRFLESG